MNIGGLDVVTVEVNTGQRSARVEGVSARVRIWVGSRVSERRVSRWRMRAVVVVEEVEEVRLSV